MRRPEQPARADQPGRRRVAAAARRRRDRPVLPAPGRPGRADRGRRRRRRRAGRRRQGPALRAVRGRRRHDPPRPRGAPGHRGAERVLAVDPGSRSPRCCPRCAELGIGFVPFSPLGQGLPDRHRRRRRPRSPTATSAPAIPRFTAENRTANQALVDHVRAAGRRPRTPPPGRSRSPGCSPSSRGSCRSRAPAGCSASEENAGGHRRSRCPPTSVADLNAAGRPHRCRRQPLQRRGHGHGGQVTPSVVNREWSLRGFGPILVRDRAEPVSVEPGIRSSDRGSPARPVPWRRRPGRGSRRTGAPSAGCPGRRRSRPA